MLLQQNSVGFFFQREMWLTQMRKNVKGKYLEAMCMSGFIFFIISLRVFFTLVVAIYVEVKKLFFYSLQFCVSHWHYTLEWKGLHMLKPVELVMTT